MRFFIARGMAAILLLIAGPALAIDKPTGAVLLTLSGQIETTNGGGHLALDQTLFESLPFLTVATETPWTDGMVTFEGVSLAALLKFAGAKGETIHAVALNDYAVDIPVTDAENPQVIVAYRMNGQTMRVRDKGPFWLIYPLSSEPSLDTEVTRSKMIWQIKELVVR